MIKFRLYSDNSKRLIDLLSLLVPEKTELEEIDSGVIIKLIYNNLDYSIRDIRIDDEGKIEIGRYRSVYPRDPEFTEKLVFISDLVDKYEDMSYTEVIDDLNNKINDKI